LALFLLGKCVDQFSTEDRPVAAQKATPEQEPVANTQGCRAYGSSYEAFMARIDTLKKANDNHPNERYLAEIAACENAASLLR
jgi:hypothetical protein